MVSKNELNEKLNQILNEIRDYSKTTFLNMLPIKNRLRNFFIEATVLLKKLSNINESAPQDTLLDFQAEVYDLECKYHRYRTNLGVMLVLLFYFGFILFLRYGVPFLKTELQINRPEKIISFALAGAFSYLLTLPLKSGTSFEFQYAKWKAFTASILLAIIIPLILTLLLFTKDGEIAKLKLTPELLSFAGGYSSKLLIEILDRIVEKVSAIIKVLFGPSDKT